MPICAAPFAPASVLSVPMYVAILALADFAAASSSGLSMLTIGTFLADSWAMPWMRLVPVIGLTMKHLKSWPARPLSLSPWPVVSVMELAAWTVTSTPDVFAWSLIPDSMVWKNGLSKPFTTAATPPEPPDVEPPHAARATVSPPMATTDAVRPMRRVR